MDTSSDLASGGLFDDRYRAFLATVTELRPRLHRYCARMTGSVLDGEDVVQDALFEAYRKLDQYDPARALAPWLFRIAHNRCVDVLRKRGAREEAEAAVAVADAAPFEEPDVVHLEPALERLVVQLPPKERACVLLKDVFGYSLVEVADLVDSTPGGVKAALNRGRTKLAALPVSAPPPRTVQPDTVRLLELYVERFNRRDWDALRELISADAKLFFADGFGGLLRESPYFGKYGEEIIVWRMASGSIDGEPAVIILVDAGTGWQPRSAVRLELADGKIARIADYLWCPWILAAAGTVNVSS